MLFNLDIPFAMQLAGKVVQPGIVTRSGELKSAFDDPHSYRHQP